MSSMEYSRVGRSITFDKDVVRSASCCSTHGDRRCARDSMATVTCACRWCHVVQSTSCCRSRCDDDQCAQSMTSGASFDLLLCSRRQLAAAAGPSATHADLTKVRLRIVHKVFNERRVFYKNRIESHRCRSLVSSIERSHRREQAAQRSQTHQFLNERKRGGSGGGTSGYSSRASSPSRHTVLSRPEDLYRFGVRVRPRCSSVRRRSIGASRSSLTRRSNRPVRRSVLAMTTPTATNATRRPVDKAHGHVAPGRVYRRTVSLSTRE
jgi:hypothetical protein